MKVQRKLVKIIIPNKTDLKPRYNFATVKNHFEGNCNFANLKFLGITDRLIIETKQKFR